MSDEPIIRWIKKIAIQAIIDDPSAPIAWKSRDDLELVLDALLDKHIDLMLEKEEGEE